ncbi:MAG: HPr family phosphocarrier protein [Phycisphaerales bacterium]
MAQSAIEKVTIRNRLGMHARPCMMLYETASRFEEETITVVRTDRMDEPADGKSIMQLMMLAATMGTELQISATGPDAAAAVGEIVALIQKGFEEE